MKKLSILKISFRDSSAFVKEKLSLFAKNGQTLYFSTCLFCCQAAFIEDYFFFSLSCTLGSVVNKMRMDIS